VIDFIKLAETGNYSAASDELNISQSSLSKHIQSLEKVLGVKLINRNSRRISLTRGGELFLPYAKQLRDTFLQVSRDMQYLISEEQLNFTLGCLPTLTFYNIMDIVAEFKTMHPEVNIVLSEFFHTTEKEITEKLNSNEYEMVFTDSIFIKSTRIEQIDYCSDHLIAVLHTDHPLAAYETIDLRKLANEPLVFLNKVTTTYQYCYDICKRTGFTPNIIFLGSRVENVLDCVSNNMGIALLMKRFTDHIQSGSIVVREINPTAQRTISLGRIANKSHSKASSQFWDFFSSRCG
jgi:DNA-binding transcriptional LysR family regulator